MKEEKMTLRAEEIAELKEVFGDDLKLQVLSLEIPEDVLAFLKSSNVAPRLVSDNKVMIALLKAGAKTITKEMSQYETTLHQSTTQH